MSTANPISYAGKNTPKNGESKLGGYGLLAAAVVMFVSGAALFWLGAASKFLAIEALAGAIFVGLYVASNQRAKLAAIIGIVLWLLFSFPGMYALATSGKISGTIIMIACVMKISLVIIIVSLIAAPLGKRAIVNANASYISVLAGLGAMLASIKVMNMPQTNLYWAVLILSGAIVGIFVFFLIWGHFQETSVAKSTDGGSQENTPAK